eukprot:1967917-Rhodomonas_salina.1
MARPKMAALTPCRRDTPWRPPGDTKPPFQHSIAPNQSQQLVLRLGVVRFDFRVWVGVGIKDMKGRYWYKLYCACGEVL